MGWETLHEGPIDLDGVDGQAVQVAQRGIPGSEVIDGHLEACFLETTERRDRYFGVLHQDPLGQFKLQVLGGHAAFTQRPNHDVHQIGLTELQGGQIDGHAYGSQAGISPGLMSHARVAERPFSNRRNDPGILCQGDKRAGKNQSLLGMLPANERFSAGDLGGPYIHLWLEVQLEFIILQRFAQMAFQPQAFGSRLIHGRRIESVGVAARGFGMTEGDFGVLE